MKAEERQALKDVVRDVFFRVSEGRSTDDVVVDEELNRRFTESCIHEFPSATPFQCNWTLFQLRKSAGLGPIVQERRVIRHGDYLHAAEIAARQMEDKHGLTIDRVLCDPDRRGEFDSIAREIHSEVDLYLLRKAALNLRKNRQFRPELIKRIADWGQVVSSHTAESLIERSGLVPRSPGIYIFSDRTGYLYIGEAEDLRARVSKHLDHSDRKALARYFWEMGTKDLFVEFHAFDPTSEGKRKPNRRAYEAELIRTRRPRFNIQGNVQAEPSTG